MNRSRMDKILFRLIDDYTEAVEKAQASKEPFGVGFRVRHDRDCAYQRRDTTIHTPTDWLPEMVEALIVCDCAPDITVYQVKVVPE